jgi:hypothetical protein
MNIMKKNPAWFGVLCFAAAVKESFGQFATNVSPDLLCRLSLFGQKHRPGFNDVNLKYLNVSAFFPCRRRKVFGVSNEYENITRCENK